MQHESVVIIGSGPAGLAAALYTARANLNPVVIAGSQIGGQVSITYEVENYPGFPEGLGGPELVEKFQKQAERFGARLEYDLVTSVDVSHGSPFTVTTSSKVYQADALIIATGATPYHLNVPGEVEFVGRGVSYCATCDGFFFRGKDVLVVGGGDSALEEGIFLTRYASHVDLIHRRDALRGGTILQERARSSPNFSYTWDTVVDEIMGSSGVEAVKLRNVKTGEVTTRPTDGVFIFIGHYPNTDLFKGQLVMDDHGYLITDKLMQSSVPGVFAAGEAQDPIYRQVATSVGQGTAAGMSAIRWLEAHPAHKAAAAAT